MLSLALLALLATPTAADRPRVYALTDAKLVVSPGETIEGATLVIRDGLIVAAGAGVEPPADADRIDAAGSWLYAGLIDLHSRLELAGGSPPREGAAASGSRGSGSRETPAGPVHPLSRIRPQALASESLRTIEGDRLREVERMRNLGFTTMLVAPGSGLLRGRSAVVQLAEERPVSAMILRDDVAQHATFERGSFGQGYPTSLMGAVAAMRQTFLDAARHAEWSGRWREEPRDLPRPGAHPAFDALAPLLDGKQPLFFEVDDPDDALLAHRLASEFELPLIIDASGHEWEIADRIAATGRTLLWPLAFPDKPKVDDEHAAIDVSRRTLRRYLEAPAAPARLHEAGIPFALTTHGLKSAGDFRKNLLKLIEKGLSEETALAALTTVPAELVGLERAIGTLETGKIANVLVSDGPLFDEASNLTHVFVDGVLHEVEAPSKPKGDPNAIVDPRGSWSVVFEMGPRSFERAWEIEGEKDAYRGSAETREGTVTFDEVRLEGNALTVVYPARGGRGSMEVTVIIEGDQFEGLAEMGSRTVELNGTRTSGPEDER